jgi:hypothetical protein
MAKGKKKERKKYACSSREDTEIEFIFSNHPSFQEKSVENISKELCIAQLWAGYGTIHSFVISFDDGTTLPLVIKRVNPRQGDSSISHQRKLKSYMVEANFYNQIAPQLGSRHCIVPIPYSIRNKDSPAKSFQFILSDLSTDYSSSYSSLDRKDTLSALSWLAKFHSAFYQDPIVTSCGTCSSDNDIRDDDEGSNSQIVWSSGGYWHLKTRLDELKSVDPSMGNKFSCFHPNNSQLAFMIDERMNESSSKSFTLVHGDYKKDNILFSNDGGNNSGECAVVDFQYCGAGYGMKDVVMLIVSSVSRSTLLEMGEESLLAFYHQEFIKFHEQNSDYDGNSSTTDEGFFNFGAMRKQYELSLLDYVRFMSGWGFWGSNVDYAEEKAWSLLKEIVSEGREIKLVKAEDIYNMTDKEWKNAIYKRYPLSEF